MGVTRLNHAVLYVSDLRRSVAFYTDVLGFRPVTMTPDGFAGAAFLQAADSTNDHDLGLFEIGPDARPSPAGRGTVGLYHLAWEVDTLDELEATAERRPPPTRSSAPPTTAPPRASTAATRTDSSSRWSGSYPRTCSTTRRSPRASASAGSTWPGRSGGTAARRAAVWASRCPSRGGVDVPCRPRLDRGPRHSPKVGGMTGPAAAIAAVKRELLVRHLEAWTPAAMHRARRATYLHGYADTDGGGAAEAAVRVFAELADLLSGRSLAMVAIAVDTVVGERLAGVQRDLRTPAELAVHTVTGPTPDRLGVALKAAGARGAPLFVYLDAARAAVPDAATLASAVVGRPTDLLLALPAGTAPEDHHRRALTDAGLSLVTEVDLVAGDGTGEALLFATASGKSLEAFKSAMWAVDEYAGVRYRDPHDPDGHLLDISLSPHPGPLRRELIARVAAVGECTVTDLRQFTLTGTAYRAADATRVLTALLGAGALTRRPEHGRLGGDVVIGPGTNAPEADD